MQTVNFGSGHTHYLPRRKCDLDGNRFSIIQTLKLHCPIIGLALNK
jgi:hypothetical protein